MSSDDRVWVTGVGVATLSRAMAARSARVSNKKTSKPALESARAKESSGEKSRAKRFTPKPWAKITGSPEPPGATGTRCIGAVQPSWVSYQTRSTAEGEGAWANRSRLWGFRPRQALAKAARAANWTRSRSGAEEGASPSLVSEAEGGGGVTVALGTDIGQVAWG